MSFIDRRKIPRYIRTGNNARNDYWEVASNVTCVRLTRGKFALVNSDDWERIKCHRWCAMETKNTFYAVASIADSFWARKTLLMHRLIMNTPDELEVDHDRANGLDNRREHLANVTHRVNQQNLHITKSSKYPGVHWASSRRQWQARILINGKRMFLGYFPEQEEDRAGQAYANAAAKLTG